MDEIKALLDKYGIWTENPDVVQRVKFALELLDRKSDELSNIRLGLTPVGQLSPGEYHVNRI